MMAVGAAGLIAGIPLLAVDGSCAGDHCRSFLDTKAGGGALMGVGAALVVAGGLVLLTSRAAPVRATLAPVVGPGAVGLVGEVRF